MLLALFAERVEELTPKILREVDFSCPELFGEFAGRHIKCAEQQVENRKRGREILVESFLFRGVMPAMKHGTCKHVAQRAKRPVQVSVGHGGIDEIEGRQHD